MPNALILHGTGNASTDNWFPWLEKQLEQKGWQVWVPDLPQADQPNIARYNQFLFNSDWEFKQDSVLIGHSSGAVAILGLLQALPSDQQVDICILVGSFKDDLGWDILDGLFEKPFDFEKIKNQAKKFIFIHSDNDPYCPLEHAQFLADKLEGQLIIKKGQKHFSTSTAGEQYRQLPLLLELLDLA